MHSYSASFFDPRILFDNKIKIVVIVNINQVLKRLVTHSIV